MFSGWEGVVVIVIAVALFGSRLPKGQTSRGYTRSGKERLALGLVSQAALIFTRRPATSLNNPLRSFAA